MIRNVIYIQTFTNKMKIFFHPDFSLLLPNLTRILIDLLEHLKKKKKECSMKPRRNFMGTPVSTQRADSARHGDEN